MAEKKLWTCLWGIALALCLTAFLFTGISKAESQAPDTIKVGSVNSITGKMALGFKFIQKGYDIAVKHINEAGGVYVKEFDKKIPLEIIYLDNESDPKKVLNRMEKLYSFDKVNFFLGGFAAHLIIPQLAIAEKHGVPIIATTIGSTAEFSKGYRYSFTPFMSEQDQVIIFLDVLDTIPRSQRPTKIAFFEIQEEWGVATGRYLKKFSAKRGYKIITHEKYAMFSNDFSSLIVKAKSAGADALYTNPTPPQGIKLVKQMKEINWSPKFIYILRGADISMWPRNMGKDGDYVTHTGGWAHQLKLPGVEKFNKDHKAAYGHLPEPVTGTSYACVQILANAIERAGTLDRDKVRDAIAATNMMTVMGPMKFKPNGRGEGKYVRLMSQWQNGKDQLIWPKDQATASLAYPMPPWDKR
jgi:branched-chain amino acid transport system substrate-binding protein